MDNDELMTSKMAAEFLGVHEKTFLGMVRTGSMPGARLGKKILTTRQALLKHIRETALNSLNKVRIIQILLNEPENKIKDKVLNEVPKAKEALIEVVVLWGFSEINYMLNSPDIGPKTPNYLIESHLLEGGVVHAHIDMELLNKSVIGSNTNSDTAALKELGQFARQTLEILINSITKEKIREINESSCNGEGIEE